MSFARKFRRSTNSRQPKESPWRPTWPPLFFPKIARFMVRGKFNSNGTVEFPRTNLDTAQQAFVTGCETTINVQMIPNLKRQGKTVTDQTALAYVMYNGPKDFVGCVMEKLKGTPDEAWQELYNLFNSNNGQGGMPLGSSLTRQELVSRGGEQAGWAFDRLADDGIWQWPNAHAVLQKRGDRVVVIHKM